MLRINGLECPYNIPVVLCLHCDCQVIHHSKFTATYKEGKKWFEWRKREERDGSGKELHYCWKAFQLKVFFSLVSNGKRILDLYHWMSCEWMGYNAKWWGRNVRGVSLGFWWRIFHTRLKLRKSPWTLIHWTSEKIVRIICKVGIGHNRANEL